MKSVFVGDGEKRIRLCSGETIRQLSTGRIWEYSIET